MLSATGRGAGRHFERKRFVRQQKGRGLLGCSLGVLLSALPACKTKHLNYTVIQTLLRQVILSVDFGRLWIRVFVPFSSPGQLLVLVGSVCFTCISGGMHLIQEVMCF